ncbi:hypothetical protein SUGI_1008900 [Cryptomeria japonica]|nr:hypothetical protein SUGI_1008900 [Cryptomeria japonica]
MDISLCLNALENEYKYGRKFAGASQPSGLLSLTGPPEVVSSRRIRVASTSGSHNPRLNPREGDGSGTSKAGFALKAIPVAFSIKKRSTGNSNRAQTKAVEKSDINCETQDTTTNTCLSSFCAAYGSDSSEWKRHICVFAQRNHFFGYSPSSGVSL